MLDCSKYDLLLVFPVSQVHAPELEGSLRLVVVAPHEVVSNLLVGLVSSRYE